MKKLIVAFAAIAMGVAAQAATTTWGSGTIVSHSGVTAANAVTMYIFDISSQEYTALAAKSGEELSKAIDASYKTVDANHTGNSNAKKIASANDTTATWTPGDSLYAAVLFVDNTDKWVAGNVATITAPSSGSAQFKNLFAQYQGTVDSGAVAWAIPEPTSGLLLLLGMAGLALKRKVA